MQCGTTYTTEQECATECSTIQIATAIPLVAFLQPEAGCSVKQRHIAEHSSPVSRGESAAKEHHVLASHKGASLLGQLGARPGRARGRVGSFPCPGSCQLSAQPVLHHAQQLPPGVQLRHLTHWRACSVTKLLYSALAASPPRISQFECPVPGQLKLDMKARCFGPWGRLYAGQLPCSPDWTCTVLLCML